MAHYCVYVSGRIQNRSCYYSRLLHFVSDISDCMDKKIVLHCMNVYRNVRVMYEACSVLAPYSDILY